MARRHPYSYTFTNDRDDSAAGGRRRAVIPSLQPWALLRQRGRGHVDDQPRREADIATRAHPPGKSPGEYSLLRRKAAKFGYALFATQSYLDTMVFRTGRSGAFAVITNPEARNNTRVSAVKDALLEILAAGADLLSGGKLEPQREE